MNKLTKVGLSALCGSLASISAAQAGTMEVLGGATATWVSNSKTVSGNNLGMNSALTFKGSGELDNGTAFTVTVTGADQAGYTSGNINMDTPGMGSIKISSRVGNALAAYDDKMPTAWEESWGYGIGTGIDMVKGVGSSMNVEWTTPSVAGATLKVAYSPKNDATFVNDKSVSGSVSTHKQGGYDVILDFSPEMLDGLNVFAGGSRTVREGKVSTMNHGDHEEVVAGFTYAIGPVKFGFQRSGEFTGSQTAGNTEYYENEAFGVSFNINDNLSISYGEHESKRHKVGSGTSDKTVTLTSDSLQLAYTMGGASIKIAEGSVANASYGTAVGKDKDGTTIALSLAF